MKLGPPPRDINIILRNYITTPSIVLFCKRVEMEEAEAVEEAGHDSQKKKKRSTEKKVKENGSAFEVYGSEGLKFNNKNKNKKRKHYEVRCSPYFQKKLSLTGDGGHKSEEKKKNAAAAEEEKEPLFSVKPEVDVIDKKTEKNIMVLEEGEEEIKKPRSQLSANIEEVLSRYAYNDSCAIPRRNVNFGFTQLKNPAFYNTPETMALS